MDVKLENKENERRLKLFQDYLHSKEYQEKLIQRLQINDACAKKAEARGITWNLCARPDNPAEGCIFFIEHFGFTFDPRKEPKHLPFILFDHQKDAIRFIISHIESGQDCLFEKSRDMGMTWLVLWVFLWYWLFKDGVNLLMGSYKEKLVDDHSDDSLFGRLDYALDNIPKWLLPRYFKKDKHRTQMKLVNPMNQNLISGDTMNPDFGRGTRKTAIFFDELGSWDYAKDAFESCFSKDTEVLTKDGWKNITKVTTTDFVYSMNPMTKEAWYMPVIKTTKRFDKELFEFHNKGVNLLVTKDHKMLVQNIVSGDVVFKEAKDIVGLKTGKIPLSSNYLGGEHVDKIYGFDSGDFMELLGWYIAEGHYTKGGTTSIAQSIHHNPKNVQRIKTLLDRMGIGFSFDGVKTFYLKAIDLDNKLRDELRSLGKCYEKSVPRQYLNLSRELLERLFESLVLGDGCQKFDRVSYTTTSKKLADDFQELCQKVGRAGNIQIFYPKNIKHRVKYVINVKKSNNARIAKLSHRVVDYNDLTYCLTTPLHTLFVRRGGIASWCGNCGDVTACRIVNSTPKGMNYYAKLRNSGIDVLTLHWKLHPLKDDTWYEFEKQRRTEEEVAQELDISYTKSQEGRVYPEWNEQNVEFGVFEYDPNVPLYVGWDFGRTDETAIIWVQPEQGSLKIVDVYRNVGKTIDFYIPFVTGIISSDSLTYSPKDLEVIYEHKYWKRGTHFGDPSGRFMNQVTNTSVLDILKQNGIIVNFQDAWKEFQRRKTAAKLLIRDGIKINKNSRTEYFDMCMVQANYPKVRIEGQDEIRSIKPLHNWTSHYRSAFEYLALGLQEFRGRQSKPFDKFKKRESLSRRSVSY